MIQDVGYAGTSTSYTDKLIFGRDITRAMVSFTHNAAGDLLISIIDSNHANNNGSIRIVGGYSDDKKRIEVIEFKHSGKNNLVESEILALANNSATDGFTNSNDEFFAASIAKQSIPTNISSSDDAIANDELGVNTDDIVFAKVIKDKDVIDPGWLPLPPVHIASSDDVIDNGELGVNADNIILESALNQLVQAHSSFGNSGADLDFGKKDDGRQYTLPVLDPLI